MVFYDEADSGNACMLISVFERDITTAVFPHPEIARTTMLEELETEFLKYYNEELLIILGRMAEKTT